MFGGPGRLMRSHLLGMLQSASILQVNRHAGRAPGVTPDRRQKSRFPRSFCECCPGIVPIQRAPAKRSASLVGSPTVIGSISSSADYFRVEEFEGRRKRESYPSATLLASWNLVGLLVRPEYYENDEDAKQELSGKAELIIAKQRNCPTGEVPLTF
jgi:hypothetical protein